MLKQFDNSSFGTKVIRENCNFSEWLRKPKKHFDFIGESEKSIELKNKIVRIAKSDLPVLILGETGSGKSYVAKMIHDLSVRSYRCFFNENISALSDSVASAELFGSVEGAFTDSINRAGYFEMADGGTLFLDEIGDASLSLQKKLLKVIETGEFRKVGSSETSFSNVRLIFATNANLREKIQHKEFREDLFYRISSLVIKIPSLRERKDDIPDFCTNYLARNGYLKLFSESALEILSDFDWPGNIRQLQNTIDRAVFNSCDSRVITPEHIEIY